MAEALSYHETEVGYFLQARGHITAAVSTDLRELVLQRLAKAPPPLLLAIDLSQCEYMDSTFMGLLVGFHKRYKLMTGRSLTVLRPSPECIKLLKGLGILTLMTVVEGPLPPSPETWSSLRPQRVPSTEVLLHAHRHLSELSPENERKFAALQGLLQKELDSESR